MALSLAWARARLWSAAGSTPLSDSLIDHRGKETFSLCSLWPAVAKSVSYCHSSQGLINHQRPHSRVEFSRQLRQRVLGRALLLRNPFEPRLLLAGLRDVAGDELFRLVRILQRGDVFAQS